MEMVAAERAKLRREMLWEIIYEILSRTSLEVVYKCRVVCREWNMMIRDPYFIHLHSRRTPTLSGVFVQFIGWETERRFISPTPSRSNEVLSLKFAPDSRDIRVLASSHLGLLYYSVVNLSSVYALGICKPTTKQWRSIPLPSFDMLKYADFAALLITDTSPLRYKIIHAVPSDVRPHKGKDVWSFHVFDSNKWEWRHAGDISHTHINLVAEQPMVLIRGTAHWISNGFRILTFDGYSESSQMRDLPWAMHPNPYSESHRGIVEYQGMLGFVGISRTGPIDEEEDNVVELRGKFLIELWVLENYGHHDGWGVWKKRHALVVNFSLHDLYEPPVTLHGNTLAVLYQGFFRSLLCIDFTTGHTISWVHGGPNRFPTAVMSFRSDWEPCHLAMQTHPCGNNIENLKEDG